MLTTLFYALFSLDETLAQLTSQHSGKLLILLFLVIFAETGLVIFPFLPGDSLLFIAGSLAVNSPLNIHLLVGTLTLAAILGDTVNYHIGNRMGPKVFQRPDSRWLRREHLIKTQAFFDRYGAFTIIIGRFIPIVRTFSPFIAGVANMPYQRFLCYNAIGGIVWIGSLTYSGYWFGNIPWVKSNLSFIVLAIVFISLLPAIAAYFKAKAKKK